MQANEFVKKFGWGEAKSIVYGWVRQGFDDSYNIVDGIYCNLPFEPTDYCETIALFDLKRLVKSWELVDGFGDIEYAKCSLERMALQVIDGGCDDQYKTLKQAIADVESCQSDLPESVKSLGGVS